MNGRYVLEGRTPKPVEDLLEWARAFETVDRCVAKQFVGNARISTVFLGLDHNFGEGPPVLFETMIFNGPHDGYQDRYSTWEEAEVGHSKAVALVEGRKEENHGAK